MSDLNFLIGQQLLCTQSASNAFDDQKIIKGKIYTALRTDNDYCILQDELGACYNYLTWAHLVNFFDMSRFEKLKAFL